MNYDTMQQIFLLIGDPHISKPHRWSSEFFAIGNVCQKEIPSNCSGSVAISFIAVLFCFWIKIDI